MQDFMLALLEASIAVSVIALVYMAITPLLSKKFSAKGRYYAWLVIIIGLIIPFRYHPQVSAIHMDTLIPVIDRQPIVSNAATKSLTIPWGILAGGLWLVGVIAFITFHVIRHRNFLKMMKRWSFKVVDGQILNMMNDIQVKLRIKQQVELRICPGISSPMLLGFIRPTILLPEDNIPIDELLLILKHELIHFKRRDVWYKALVFLATALHWFNPFVYIIAREIAIQCEISCDEEVVKNTDIVSRQRYVEAIIGIIRKQSKEPSIFSTNFYSGKQGMKHRVYSIMDARSKKWGMSILIIIVLSTLSTGTILKVNAPTTPKNSVTISNVEVDLNVEQEVDKGSTVSEPILQDDKIDPQLVTWENEPDEPKLMEVELPEDFVFFITSESRLFQK